MAARAATPSMIAPPMNRPTTPRSCPNRPSCQSQLPLTGPLADALSAAHTALDQAHTAACYTATLGPHQRLQALQQLARARHTADATLLRLLSTFTREDLTAVGATTAVDLLLTHTHHDHAMDLDFLASSFELAGGHIRSGAITAAYLAAEAGRPVGMAELVGAVGREYRKLGRLTLESEFGQYLSLAG